MLLIEGKNINKWIGARNLLDKINFNIYSDDRIGLVGRNGTGKTTLLKIILGYENDFTGEINKNTKIGYLPQFYNYQEKQTVEDFFTEVSYDYGSFMDYMMRFGK